jgi:peptidoglycan/xylan/chitin deacetylase (PgdA/CDA1 family)
MILDCLNHRNVRATFFVQGTWAQAYPGMVDRMVKEGHLVGSHGYSHCVFSRMSSEGMIKDLQDSRKALADVGVDPVNSSASLEVSEMTRLSPRFCLGLRTCRMDRDARRV